MKYNAERCAGCNKKFGIQTSYEIWKGKKYHDEGCIKLTEMKSLTCLEEAKKTNDDLESNNFLLWKEKRLLETCLNVEKSEGKKSRQENRELVRLVEELKPSKVLKFFTILAVALIAFIGGIFFTWERIGMPKNVTDCHRSSPE